MHVYVSVQCGTQPPGYIIEKTSSGALEKNVIAYTWGLAIVPSAFHLCALRKFFKGKGQRKALEL